jgi:hypothetical protein
LASYMELSLSQASNNHKWACLIDQNSNNPHQSQGLQLTSNIPALQRRPITG